MRLYPLDKIVLKLSPNAAKLLNGLSSNTLDQSQNAFLSLHGRIIATFEQIQISEDEVWIVVASFCYEVLLAHLDRYAKLNKTVIEKTDWKVYFDLDGDYPLEGERSIRMKVGRIIVSSRNLQVNVSTDEFNFFRLKHHVPLHGIDYPSDILILNVDPHDYVSYTKGCFLGQEPVAKVHNRSKPSWKLVVRDVLQVSEADRPKMTSVTTDPATGKSWGFIFVANI